MSFNFDSNSDNEGIDLDVFDDTGLLALSSRQELISADVPKAAALPVAGDDVNWEDADSDENVDWEDADELESLNRDFSEVENDLDRKMPALPAGGVTITFSSTSNTPADELVDNDESPKTDGGELKWDGESTKKRKRRTVRVLKDVPHHTQQLILGVRRAHLLCCVARSVKCSSLCSEIDAGSSNHQNDDNSANLLLNLAHSLVPMQYHLTKLDASKYVIPADQQLKEFSMWFFDFIDAAQRRRDAIEQNIARGAAGRSPTSNKRTRRSARPDVKRLEKKRRSNSPITSKHDETLSPTVARPSEENSSAECIPSVDSLMAKFSYLSRYYDDDPQMFMNDGIDVIGLVESITSLEKVLLFLAMVRSLGWRARFVSTFDPLPLQLTVDHPLLEFGGNIETLFASRPIARIISEMIKIMKEDGVLKSPKGKKLRSATTRPRSSVASAATVTNDSRKEHALYWVEVLRSDIKKSDKKNKKEPKHWPKDEQPANTANWVAILPHQKRYDAPLDIEVFLAQLENDAGVNDTSSSEAKQALKSKKGKNPSLKCPKRKVISYVLAIEHFQSSHVTPSVRLTDVTPRYASAWSKTLRLRGAIGRELAQTGGKCVDEWWTESLKVINRLYQSKSSGGASLNSRSVRSSLKPALRSKPPLLTTKMTSIDGKEVELFEIASSSEDEKPDGITYSDESDQDDLNHGEAKELSVAITKEPMPTSKAAFKQHPQYVIPSVLNSTEVLHPDARKHICGVFKGEMVYRRKDVSKALRAKKWLYQGRKVKEIELDNPVKKVKARMKRTKKFQVLDSYVDQTLPTQYDEDNCNEMDNLYGIWQTQPWSPPHVRSTDPIPVNEYKNVELALINPGLTHMKQPRMSAVAKKLGIPYAPCMCGFEGHRGNQTPTVHGIVVHDHNVELLSEAYLEFQSQLVESEISTKTARVLKKWKRLVVGLLTKDRLDRAYG